MLSAAAELESQGSLRRSPNPRLPIEMLLLRMSFLDRTVSLEELIGALGGAPVRSSDSSAAPHPIAVRKASAAPKERVDVEFIKGPFRRE